MGHRNPSGAACPSPKPRPDEPAVDPSALRDRWDRLEPRPPPPPTPAGEVFERLPPGLRSLIVRTVEGLTEGSRRPWNCLVGRHHRDMETSGRYYLHGPDHGMIRAGRSTTCPPDGVLAKDRRIASSPGPLGCPPQRACDWAGVPPELDPETGPASVTIRCRGCLVVRTCREARGSGDRGGSPTRHADAPSRPEGPTGSGPGWQNRQVDGRGRQACGRWPASLPVAMGGLVSVYRR